MLRITGRWQGFLAITPFYATGPPAPAATTPIRAASASRPNGYGLVYRHCFAVKRDGLYGLSIYWFSHRNSYICIPFRHILF